MSDTVTPRPIQAEDLFGLRFVQDPQVSPDGRRVAFVVRHTDVEKNTYRSEIWVGSTGDAEPSRRWTGGDWNDSLPRWSPDGSTLAFVSNRNDEKSQLFLLPVAGGEASALTGLGEGGIDDLQWSPDGASLAFLYRATPEIWTKKAVEERKERHRSTPPRVHTRLFYRLDGAGYWDGSYSQVYVIATSGGDAKRLTDGARPCQSLAWSPDSGTIAFLSDRRDDWDSSPEASTDIWTVPAAGGEITRIESPQCEKSGLAWSPDGATFAYCANPDPTDQWGTRNERLYTLPAAGAAAAQDMTPGPTGSVGYLCLSDARDSGGPLAVWAQNSSAIYFPASEFGTTRLYRVSVAMDPPSVPVALTPLDQEMGTFGVGGDGVVAISLGNATRPHEMFCGSCTGDTLPLNRLTDLHREWTSGIVLQTPITLTGDVPGWLLLPPDTAPGHASPLVLYIHGGPHLQYGLALFHELQWLAAQGYAVAYCNPRGSKGYGEAYTGAIKGNWGDPALEDVLKVVDEAVARGFADPSRLAVMGGSYGGYLTAWAVGHTDRFKCAIADRLVANLHSMSGTVDFPWSHGTYYTGNAWDDPSDLWRHSPLAFAGRINTPLLLIHSDGDLRCPVGQAEELFAALRLQKKPVEFVRYPAETSHGLSRNGPPDLRLDRLHRNLAWLDQHLKPAKTE